MPMTMRAILLSGSLLTGSMLALPTSSPATPAPAEPKPPLVSTGYAPEVSTSSSTVRGSVDPRGAETSFYVQYGTTAGYGAQTPPTAVGSGTQEVKVSQAISGLQANTTYHYRVVAGSSAGTTAGEDRTFTTKKVPLTFKVLVTRRTDVFGSPFSISGTLVGSESAGHAVVLQANPFPYVNGFKDVGTAELTDPLGNFSFSYSGLLQSTEFRISTVGSPPVMSPGLLELLALRVTFHAHPTARAGFFQLDGSVAPASADTRIVFQRIRAGHKPQGVGRAALKRVNSRLARYRTTLRVGRGGLYRAYAQVLSGRQISHYSSSIRIR